ncbi:hypothetical protein DB30_05570 [Enhygromyxa salina]|uniref:Uncharacterized protein n=1 Tax=Enhygromyxa salina TaxID=215803 RepID=A0A0C1ZWM2_9BACT|nr:hypothetical protein [Enhygromyxa salina]KIG15453.1 hypothetical protein DB30_05570 [Enhygromyxa salina]
MLDTLQFEGPFARFTLRAWGTEAREQQQGYEPGHRPGPQRVRCDDEHDALALLRGATEPDMLRRLRAFLVEQGADPGSLAGDPLNLLGVVARRIVSGALVLEREPVVLMSSEPIELAAPPPFEPLANEIVEVPGLHARALAESELAAQRSTLECQAMQAQTLKVAAEAGVPFCEVCAGAHAPKLAGESTGPDLATQAKQAKTLEQAADSGVPFCEACANCEGPPNPGAPVASKTEPLATGLGRQASQAKTLAAASSKGTPFCEHCTC